MPKRPFSKKQVELGWVCKGNWWLSTPYNINKRPWRTCAWINSNANINESKRLHLSMLSYPNNFLFISISMQSDARFLLLYHPLLILLFSCDWSPNKIINFSSICAVYLRLNWIFSNYKAKVITNRKWKLCQPIMTPLFVFKYPAMPEKYALHVLMRPALHRWTGLQTMVMTRVEELSSA